MQTLQSQTIFNLILIVLFNIKKFIRKLPKENHIIAHFDYLGAGTGCGSVADNVAGLGFS